MYKEAKKKTPNFPVFYPSICLLYYSPVPCGSYKQAQSARTNKILSGSQVYKPTSDPLITQKRYRLNQIARRVQTYEGSFINNAHYVFHLQVYFTVLLCCPPASQ